MKSTKIIQFPVGGRFVKHPTDKALNVSTTSYQVLKASKWRMMWYGPIGLVWLLASLLWPLLNWLGALDVVFQCSRALYYLNTPATNATLQAGLHVAVYLLLSAFVYLYRPGDF